MTESNAWSWLSLNCHHEVPAGQCGPDVAALKEESLNLSEWIPAGNSPQQPGV